MTYIGVIVGVAASSFFTQSWFNPSIDEKLVQVANKINKTCPITINEYAVLENVLALLEKTINVIMF